MTPSDRIAELEHAVRYLWRRCERAEAELRGRRRGERRSPGGGAVLTRQEQALLDCLRDRAPRIVSLWALLEAMPGHDHAQERSDKLVQVVVNKIRKKLGRDAIETVWGQGYRLGSAAKPSAPAGD